MTGTTATGDGRRRQYVPLSVHFAGGHSGQALLERLGIEGLAAWACLLAAAKKAPVQGEVEWYTDDDAWRTLGLGAHRPGFTFHAFTTVLGRLHLAKTTKRGEVKTTSIRAWNEWNTTIKRDLDAAKKRRKRAENTRDEATTFRGTEGEGEGEYPPTPRREGKNPRATGTNPRSANAHACPFCSQAKRTQTDLDEHLLNVHDHRLTPEHAQEIRRRLQEDTPA